MSEIERAIEYYKENEFYFQKYNADLVTMKMNELALTALKEKLEREKNAPLTWDERINQMTVEEKVLMLNDLGLCLVGKDTPISNCKREDACTACLTEWLNSPYTEGATK